MPLSISAITKPQAAPVHNRNVSSPVAPCRAERPHSPPGGPGGTQAAARRLGEALSLIERSLTPRRQLVREGDVICEVGQRFDCLYVLNSGCCKVVTWWATAASKWWV